MGAARGGTGYRAAPAENDEEIDPEEADATNADGIMPGNDELNPRPVRPDQTLAAKSA